MAFGSSVDIGTLLFNLLGFALTDRQLQDAFGRQEELRLQTEAEANLLSESLTPGALLGGTGFDTPVSLGGIDVGGFENALRPARAEEGTGFGTALNVGPRGAPDQRFDLSELFTSADVFQAGLPEGGFDPINPKDFAFDPTEIQELGANLGEDIRGGAVDFSTLLSQSNVEGLTDRAAARFPDFDAFRTERLGGIADAAREAQTQARQQLGGGFSSVGEGQAELARREFAGNLSAGRAGSELENAIQALLGQQATTLAGVDQFETGERGRLSTSAAADAQTRDLDAAQIEARLFAEGEGLEATNKGLLADIERFNRTFPVDVASQGAQFTAQDEGREFNALLAQAMARLQANTGSGQSQAALLNMIAQLRANTSQPVLPISTSVFDKTINAGRSDDRGDPGTKVGFSFIVTVDTCVDGACRIDTPRGPRPLARIAIGDYVMAADGHFRKVVAKDYGTVPPEHRSQQTLIQTAQDWLSITEDHPIGGRPARLWRPGDGIPALGGKQRIIAVRTIPYRVSGDLMLEGNVDYVANGFAVESAIGKFGLERWTRVVLAAA